MLALDLAHVASLLDAALCEDIGSGDLTSQAICPPDAIARGRFVAREAGVLAGGPLLAALFEKIDVTVRVALCKEDGDALAAGDVVATIEGPAASVLPGERTALNFLQRLSGIATGDQAIFLSRECFDRVGGFPDQPLMEDVELSARLRALAAPVCLRARVVTSARRWKRHGTWPTILTMWSLRLAYACGVPSTALARFYR